MMLEIAQFAIKTIICFLIISVGLSFFHWKRLPSTFQRLAFYLCLNLLVEIALRIMSPYKLNNLPLLHVYTLLEFILFSWIYRSMGIFDKWSSQQFWTFVTVVAALIVANSLFLQSIFIYNSYAKSLVQACLVFYSIAYIFQLRPQTPSYQALNILNTAVLTYYAGSSFIFMAGNVALLIENSEVIWVLNVAFIVIFQCLVLASIWRMSRVRQFMA